ncbi:MAG: DNA-primase RepB domain-containing protein [Planctomycetota bacterium]
MEKILMGIETSDALRFLSALHGEELDGYFEILAFRDGKPSNAKAMFYLDVAAVDSDWKTLDALSHNRFNISIGIGRRKGKSISSAKKDILCMPALFADMDVGHVITKNDIDRLTKTLPSAIPFPPSVIVISGHGYHLYWLLKDPFHIGGHEDVLKFEGCLKRLAAYLKSDPAATDVVRFMRLPGTTNWKDVEKPVKAVLVECHAERRYNIEDFDSFLPEMPRASRHFTPYPELRWEKGNVMLIQNNQCAMRHDSEKDWKTARIYRVHVEKSKRGNSMTVVTFEILGEAKKRYVRDFFVQNHPVACRRMLSLHAAVRLIGRKEVRNDDLLGKELMIIVAHQEYEGRPRLVVKQFKEMTKGAQDILSASTQVKNDSRQGN